MSSEDTPAPAEAPAAKKPQSLLPPSRIILLIVLAVAIVVLIVDRVASHGADAAFKAIQEANRGENPDGAQEPVPGKALSPEDIQKVVGREPDEDSWTKGQQRQESYSWRGVRRKYQVRVIYTASDDNKGLVMVDVAVNDDPKGWKKSSD